jgi:hypothetical protein
MPGSSRRHREVCPGRSCLRQCRLEVDITRFVVVRVDVGEIIGQYLHTPRLQLECLRVYAEIRVQIERHDAVRQKNDLR